MSIEVGVEVLCGPQLTNTIISFVVLLGYAIGLPLVGPLPCCWEKTAPSPIPEASVSSMKVSSKLEKGSIGGVINDRVYFYV